MEFTHKNWFTNKFLSKSRTLNFWPLLHRQQIFMWAGHTHFEGEVQNSSSFLQVSQKYETYNLMDKIWGLFQNFYQPNEHDTTNIYLLTYPLSKFFVTAKAKGSSSINFRYQAFIHLTRCIWEGGSAKLAVRKFSWRP